MSVINVNYKEISREDDIVELHWLDDGTQVFVKNDKQYENGYNLSELTWHKIGYPAYVDGDDGELRWYVNDIRYEMVLIYCKACNFDNETTLYWYLKYGEWLPEYKKEL